MNPLPLEGRKVWIYIPTYTGTVHAETTRCLMYDTMRLAMAGSEVVFAHESYNAMIAHIRNVIVSRFLADKDATDLFFIDWDVAWHPGLMVALMKHPVDVVAAIYPKKQDEPGFFFKPVPGRKKLIPNGTTGLLEVAGVPAGFLRISRRALERMVKEHKSLAYACPESPSGRAYGLFDQIHEGMDKLGEDYSFCERWRRAGGKVWVHANAPMRHTGVKTWDGNFADYMERLELVDGDEERASAA